MLQLFATLLVSGSSRSSCGYLSNNEAVSDFESRVSNHLYFSIKPLQADTPNYIPFLVRTQWRYTYWIKITFSFLAEDRSDIEANYYQIDSGNLGNCYTGK